MFQMQQGRTLILQWGVWNVWPWIFKHLLGTCKDQQGQAGPWSERPIKDYWDEGNSLRATSPKLRKKEKVDVGGKEEVWAHKAHAFPFPRDHPNLSPTDLPARKKHDAVPPQLLNADPLVQIIGMGNYCRCHYQWCRSLCPSRLQSPCWSHDPGLCWGKELQHKADDWVEWLLHKFKISSQIQDHLVWLCWIQPSDSRDFNIWFWCGWRWYSLHQVGPTHHRN